MGRPLKSIWPWTAGPKICQSAPILSLLERGLEEQRCMSEIISSHLKAFTCEHVSPNACSNTENKWPPCLQQLAIVIFNIERFTPWSAKWGLFSCQKMQMFRCCLLSRRFEAAFKPKPNKPSGNLTATGEVSWAIQLVRNFHVSTDENLHLYFCSSHKS